MLRLCGKKEGEERETPRDFGFGVMENILPEEIEDAMFKGTVSMWDINLSAQKWGSKPYPFENSVSFLPTKQL